MILAGFTGIEITPVVEQVDPKPGALDRLQVLLGDDRIGIDVGPVKCRDDASEIFQICSCLTPLSARARPQNAPRRRRRRPSPAKPGGCGHPGPADPSKLRFEVEAQRSPGSSRSAFIPRHIEQPGSRHSKPAARKILVQTLFLGLLLYQSRSGNRQRELDVVGQLAPLREQCAAADRKSSIRELVQEPMKTLSTINLVERCIFACQAHVVERGLHAARLDRVGLPARGRESWRQRRRPFPVRCPRLPAALCRRHR